MKKICFYLGTRLEAFEALIESHCFSHVYLFTNKVSFVYEKYKDCKKIENLEEFNLIILPQDKELSLSLLEKLSLKVNPDFMISVGFPYIIPSNICDLFKGKIFNLHPHILPEWPGYSPIKKSFLDGQKIYGATIHYLTSDLDSGDIVLQLKVDLDGLPLEKIYQKIFKVLEPLMIQLFLKRF